VAVLLYQLAIVVTLVLTRVVASDRLSTAALIWTGLTLLNLFWPPLIILQLLVIWGTFALLGGLRHNSDKAGSQSSQPKSNVPAASATQASHDENNPASVLDRADTTVNATQRSVESAASVPDMLNKYIEDANKHLEDARAKQDARQKIEEAVYLKEFREKAAEKQAEHQKALEKKLSADPEFKQLYIEARNQLQPVMREIREQLGQDKVDPPSSPVSLSSPGSLSGSETIQALNNINLGLGTLSTYVNTARTTQSAQAKIEMKNFLISLEEDPAIAIAERRKKRANRLAKDGTSAIIGSTNATAGLPAHVQESSPLLDVARQEIMETATALKIPGLVHFTRARNLESILKYGLCSNAKAGELGIKLHTNDPLRLDGHLDAISLSILFPNYKMFYKYRQEEPNEEWVVLIMGPGILWRKKCAFCQRNAADHRIRQRSAFDLMNADALRGMFEELEGIPSRQEQRLEDFDPTDPQAEVLVFETIEPNWIEYIAFNSDEVMSKYSHLKDSQRNWRVVPQHRGVFASRRFVRKAYN
jgi:hypothetical protein